MGRKCCYSSPWGDGLIAGGCLCWTEMLGHLHSKLTNLFLPLKNCHNRVSQVSEERKERGVKEGRRWVTAVEMLTGARGAAPRPLLVAGSSAGAGHWFPLPPGSVSRAVSLKPLLQQRYLCGPSAGQDMELIPTHWEVLSANLPCPPPAPSP